RTRACGLEFFGQLAQHHFENGEQDAKLDRSRLHARRAGDSHRAGGEIDFLNARLLDDVAAPFDVLAEDIVGIVVNEVDFCADIDAFPGRADDEGSFAALGNGEDNVFGGNSKITDLFLAELSKVLKAFNGFNESEVATGHDAEGAMFEVFRG